MKLTKKPYSDARWNDHPPIDKLGDAELGLSEEEKAKRRKFLDDVNVQLLGKHIDEKEIPENLKAKR